MNIEFRPSGGESKSGGRGEYELAGSQGELHPKDLYGVPMLLEILPGVAINAQSRCLEESGKPRIRQIVAHRFTHPYALIAAAMILPEPRRSWGKTAGGGFISHKQFVVETVRADFNFSGDTVLVRPVVVRIGNKIGQQSDIIFAERMNRVIHIWTAARALLSTPDRHKKALAGAVRQHEVAFTSMSSTQADLLKSFRQLYVKLGKPHGDLLSLLEHQFNIDSAPATIYEPGAVENVLVEDNETSPAVARIERVQQWRSVKNRGASAVAFRKDVREAYRFRCLFSGQYLPQTDTIATAGVDAAHILPWSRYDLDVVANGICLNKQYHWAFDQGLLRVIFDKSVRSYVVIIPAPMQLAAQSKQFDMSDFQAVTGVIPENRLPTDTLLRPSSQYLNELYRFLDADTA